MANHSSASTLSHDIRHRALRIINNNSYDYYTRQFIRYALNINDPWTASMVHRAERGEDVVDNLYSTTSQGGGETTAVIDPSIEYDSLGNHPDEDDSIEFRLEELPSEVDPNEHAAHNIEADRLLDEKLEHLTTLICRPGNDPITTSAALLVLLSTISNSKDWRTLLTTTKNLAFLHCCELNSSVMESQTALFERELLSGVM